MERFQSPLNFMGLPDELADRKRAKVWLLPIPYEATTSYGAGTRNGPDAILTASRQVEWFDREWDCEPVAGFGVHTLPPLATTHGSPEAMTRHVADAVRDLLTGEPAPRTLAILGGEHSISGGVARGMAATERGRDMVAVQIDAHADLRDEYEGSPFSHACAARRILETCPVFQIGIRNISEAEERFRKICPHVRTVFAEDARPGGDWLADLAAFVQGKNVFMTIDLDGLDPSIMPAVGTPEPGGLSWETTLDVVRTVCREAAAVPVFDVVELAPIPGMIAPDFLAARLAYKIMAMIEMRPPARSVADPGAVA